MEENGKYGGKKMKKNGIYNAKLSEVVGKMGHGDIILIGDVGCPFPRHDMTTCIDLAVTDGVPKVTDVVKAVIGANRTGKGRWNKGNAMNEETIPHMEMKNLWLNGSLEGKEVKAFVRTGERCPYCYIALVAGVDF